MRFIKRIFSLFLMSLIVFNAIGYYGLYMIVQRQLTTPVLQRIETDASEIGGNLIFVIPLETSHASATEEYTRVDGEITYQGEVYRLVKQKYFNNMLYVVCVKDDKSSDGERMLADYSKLFSDQDAGHANSNIKILNLLSKYYTVESHAAHEVSSGWTRAVSETFFSESYSYESGNIIFRPPCLS